VAGAIGVGMSWRQVLLVSLGGTGDESTVRVEGLEVVTKRAAVTGEVFGGVVSATESSHLCLCSRFQRSEANLVVEEMPPSMGGTLPSLVNCSTGRDNL
jgi:hypothetical protein